MIHIQKSAYKHSRGVKMPSLSKVQLSGYVPDEKRVADLLHAGLLRSAVADEYYDTLFDFAGIQDLPAIPPLPRAFPSTLAEVSEVAREFKERSLALNERLAKAVAEGKIKRKVAEPDVKIPMEDSAQGADDADAEQDPPS